jgi:hypothetical protein
MSLSSQTFCFFLDRDSKTDLPTLPTPDGLTYFELSGRQCFSILGERLSGHEAGDRLIELEAIRSKTQSSLLMTIEPGMRVTVNGLLAACFSVLRPGDVLGIEEHVLHLSLLNRPYTGPPDRSHLSAKCGYCRVKILDKPGMRVYVCPNCQLPTHSQGEEIPVEERLECARLSSHCGHCQSDIVKSEGFTHVPTL